MLSPVSFRAGTTSMVSMTSKRRGQRLRTEEEK